MKKILLLAAAMLLGMPAQMLAQTDDTEEKKEDVITVTDKQGNEEEIEVPVGLEDNLDSNDVLFYKERSDVHEIMLPMTDGCYAIFFPEDVHRPCCMMDAPEDVKKIVLKVRVDSL